MNSSQKQSQTTTRGDCSHSQSLLLANKEMTSSCNNSSFTNRSVVNSVAAGYCAGITGTIVGHPLDSLKVWLQTGGVTNIGNSKNNNVATTTTTPETTTTTMIQSQQQNAASTVPNSTRVVTTTNNTTPTNTASTISSSRAMSTLASPASSASSTTFSITQQHNKMNTNYAMKTIRRLYAGVTGPLLTIGIIQSINFAIYDSCRRILYAYDHPNNNNNKTNNNMEYLHADSLYNVGISSMIAGVALSVVTNPLVLIKTRQQTAFRNGINGSNNKLGFIEACKQVLHGTNRRQQCFKGYAPHFIAEVFGRGVYFVTYESVKRQFIANNNDNSNKQQYQCTLYERMISASAAGIVCWASIYPFDVIRCRIHASTDLINLSSSSTITSTPSVRSVIQTMYSTGGIKSFYRGFGVTILRAGPVAAFVLPVYDLALEQMSTI